MNRRDFIRLGAGSAALACGLRSEPMPASDLQRALVPSSGRPVARIGLGTWRGFDVGSDLTARGALAEVLRAFAAAGGDLVDTSPMYGSAEAVLGDLAAETGLREKLFFATKVWTSGGPAGVAQMESSLRKLRTGRVELMEIHNLLDWRTHLPVLRRWKEEGRIGHVGVTHYTAGALDELARVIRAERLDFVQYALSLEEPQAAGDFLKLCADRGTAFIANRPFAEGAAFAKVRGKPLPPWAGELGITSWPQFLLKWILAHPEVTCAIAGTSRAAHLQDNLQAARGPALNAADRERLRAHWERL
jgi:aryl-alcohol dehydrogenase-like predicted oxidoreductase